MAQVKKTRDKLYLKTFPLPCSRVNLEGDDTTHPSQPLH